MLQNVTGVGFGRPMRDRRKSHHYDTYFVDDRFTSSKHRSRMMPEGLMFQDPPTCFVDHQGKVQQTIQMLAAR